MRGHHIFIGAFALWPILAFLGGAGFSAIIVLTGIGALVALRQGLTPNAAAGMFLLFLIWAAITESWSPAWRGFASGSILEGNFGVHSGGLRILLTGFFVLCTVALACWIRPRMARSAVGAARIGGGVQVVGLAAIAILGPLAYSVFASISDPTGEAPQNVIRNALSFSIILPVLTAPLFVRGGWVGVVIALLVTLIAIFLVLKLDAGAAALGIAGSLVAVVLVTIAPKRALSGMLVVAALLFVLAPAWVGGLAALVKSGPVEMNGSVLSRVYSWNATLEKVSEKPILGHGMQASKSWTETYAERGDWTGPEIFNNFPIIPGHPHNMPLQVWAETGLVGALLVALVLCFLAFKLRHGHRMPPDARMAGTMMVTTVLAPVCVSYSMWNEAFWAMVALAACAVVLIGRAQEVE